MSMRKVLVVLVAVALIAAIGAVAVAAVISAGDGSDTAGSVFVAPERLDGSIIVDCGPVCPGPGTDRG